MRQCALFGCKIFSSSDDMEKKKKSCKIHKSHNPPYHKREIQMCFTGLANEDALAYLHPPTLVPRFFKLHYGGYKGYTAFFFFF